MSRRSETFTIGVEEEYQIIDPQTRALSADAREILPLAQELLGDAVQHELMLSQIEIATPVCATLQELEAELQRLRGGVISAAERAGRQIAAAGTHPFSAWQEQQITPKSRYQQLIGTFQQQIQEQVIFGCHVHVGIEEREMALQVLNRARLWLPMLIVLSANSPFWLGADTQYASYRTSLWWSAPLAGPPPVFTSYAEYQKLVRDLVMTRSLEDETHIYWDIRLSKRFPTIEFRVMDVCLTVSEALLLAGLVRALVKTCYEQAQRDEPFPRAYSELLRAANWRASRFGIRKELIDVETMSALPAHELLERFLERMRPALEEAGDWERISQYMQALLRRGNGAMRQRSAFQRQGRIEDVVDFIVAETARGSL